MSRVEIKINPQVLRWARETIALSRTAASEKIGIPVKRLSQLEEGDTRPSLNELKAMSKTYRRTIASLLLKQPPDERPFPADMRTADSKESGHFHEKTIMVIRKARALTRSLIDLRKEAGISELHFNYKATLQQSPNEIARQVNEKWRLDRIREIDNSRDALNEYIDAVESLGVAVFQLSLTEDDIRGFSLLDDLIPIIGIKRGDVVTAKVFTLFHELGHVLLRKGGICDLSEASHQKIEKWCNAFAAEIIIPSRILLNMEIVKQQATSGEKVWTKGDLIEIGNQFHAGPLTILRRLLDHRLTTVAFYREKHVAWNKPVFGRSKHPEGRNPAKETIAEKGKRYISLAFQVYDQNRIDLKDLSDFLGVRLSYIPQTRQLLNR